MYTKFIEQQKKTIEQMNGNFNFFFVSTPLNIFRPYLDVIGISQFSWKIPSFTCTAVLSSNEGMKKWVCVCVRTVYGGTSGCLKEN